MAGRKADSMTADEKVCPQCRGEGELIQGEDEQYCSMCNGTGKVAPKETLSSKTVVWSAPWVAEHPALAAAMLIARDAEIERLTRLETACNDERVRYRQLLVRIATDDGNENCYQDLAREALKVAADEGKV